MIYWFYQKVETSQPSKLMINSIIEMAALQIKDEDFLPVMHIFYIWAINKPSASHAYPERMSGSYTRLS
jgi:hypothetical protein